MVDCNKCIHNPTLVDHYIELKVLYELPSGFGAQLPGYLH